eukprot:jgi/Tetstr1/434115/TSEL_023259.t1
MVSGNAAYLRSKLLGEGDSIGQWEMDVRAQQAAFRRAHCYQDPPPAAQPLSDVRTFVIPVCVAIHFTALVVDAEVLEPLVCDSMGLELNSQHTLIMSMFREFVTRMMMQSSDPGVRIGLCWENVHRLLDVADAKARTIPVAEEQLQDDIWTCGWRVLFFIYCLLKLEPGDDRRSELLSAGTCREFSTKALESFRNNVVQRRSAQDGVVEASTDTDIVPIDLCARVDKPKDGLRPFTPWAARRIAQVRGWKAVTSMVTVALVETVPKQEPSGLVQQEAAAGKAPEPAPRRVDDEVILPPEDMLDIADHTQVKPYDGEKEGEFDPWKLWHWARSAPETWVGRKQSQMKRKALFAALLELRRAFVAGAEKAGELAPEFWSWPVIALLFTPANAPAQITHIDGQAPNLHAILACTCHCRPTEVYRGAEVSFTDAVKHIRYPGHENHRLTERTLAETDPGAADFITSHKNLMQPLEDLERGMGVPEENKPYMEQYHGYMFGSDTTHRGPMGAPVELPGGNPCPKCHGHGTVRLYGQGHLLGLPGGCGGADDPTQYTPFLAAYNEALYPHITPRSDAAEKRNHQLAAEYVAHFGDHAVLPNHLYSDEDYASIHARAKELRLVAVAAAFAAAAAASIPP